jgi:hypothetical protein
METADLRTLTWKKSSHSTGNPSCVEIAHAPQAVAVRDSKDPYGPALVVSPATFARFLDSLR